MNSWHLCRCETKKLFSLITWHKPREKSEFSVLSIIILKYYDYTIFLVGFNYTQERLVQKLVYVVQKIVDGWIERRWMETRRYLYWFINWKNPVVWGLLNVYFIRSCTLLNGQAFIIWKWLLRMFFYVGICKVGRLQVRSLV